MNRDEAVRAFIHALAKMPATEVLRRAKAGKPSVELNGWAIVYGPGFWRLRPSGGPDEFGFTPGQVIKARRKLRLASQV